MPHAALRAPAAALQANPMARARLALALRAARALQARLAVVEDPEAGPDSSCKRSLALSPWMERLCPPRRSQDNRCPS